MKSLVWRPRTGAPEEYNFFNFRYVQNLYFLSIIIWAAMGMQSYKLIKIQGNSKKFLKIFHH